MANPNIVTVNESNFQSEVISATQPVLLDFWAEWCGPCRLIAPMLDEIAKEKAGVVKVGKVNVDESQSLSAQFGIRAIPTLLLFKNGAVVEQVVGVASKADLSAKIDAHV